MSARPLRLTLAGNVEALYILVGTYPIGGSTWVELVDRHDEPYATLSVNLEGAPLPTGYQFWLKAWSENAEVAHALEEGGYIAPVSGMPPFPTGYVEARLYALTGTSMPAVIDTRVPGGI